MVKKKDLKKGQYYRYIYLNGNYIIGKCNVDGNTDCFYAARTKEMYDFNEFWGRECSFSMAKTFILATQNEINWLEKCKKENKFVPFIKNQELEIEIW